jgi:membrane protease YdiL (CAAX protease family)
MGNIEQTKMNAVSSSPDVPNSPPSYREQLIEILVFLFLILPSLAYSFTISVSGGTLTSPLNSISIILRDLSLVLLILFFLWHNREPLKRIGWTFFQGYRDILLGAVLFLPLFFFSGFLDSFLASLGLSSVNSTLPPSPSDPYLVALTLILVIVVAIAEETIFRGYILLRLHAVTRSLPVAVVLSAVIFSIGHGYEGNAGVITIGVLGLIYALIYLWRGSLVTPVVLHFLQDFTVLLVFPYFMPG